MTMKNVLPRLRAELGKLQAYAVPDASGYVKLDAMENPFSLPVELRSLWLEKLSQCDINRYPEPNPAELKQKLKQRFGPVGNVDMLLGNGSDELIQLLTLAIAKPNACMVTVSPSFSMYVMIANTVGVKCHVVPLLDDFKLDVKAMLAKVEQTDPALIFIAFPNNPTGNLWDKESIRSIVRASNGLVVIDEAYGPFADDTFSNELEQYPNMLLLRTASKLGLAGIRFGWMTGDAGLIAELNKLRLPYNINQLTQLSMNFALDNYAVFAQQAKQICSLREKLYQHLKRVEGLQVFPSSANFILFKIITRDANEIYNRLLEQKILIKDLSSQVGLDQCLRVTVGTEEENKTFITALRQVLVS